MKEWLLEAGLQIDLDGLGAKVIGRSPFLVVPVLCRVDAIKTQKSGRRITLGQHRSLEFG